MTPTGNAKTPSSSLIHSITGLAGSSNSRPMLSEADRASALLDLAIGLVDSALDILHNHLSSDEQLKKASLLMPGGTVGKHLRHVIETFRAFLDPLHPQSSTLAPGKLVINYDALLPSTRRPLARSLPASRAAMISIREDLIAWGDRCQPGPQTSHSRPIRDLDVNLQGPGPGLLADRLATEMSSPVELIAVTPTKQVLQSSVDRELWFCCLHAIHHFSMLRTIAVHELGLDLPVEFGTAPSTLLYRGKGWKAPEVKKAKLIKAKL